MKRVILGLLTVLAPALSFAQTGPGGIGNSSDNILWLDANSLDGTVNGTAITTWTDGSGNNNDATQTPGVNTPTFETNSINGFPTISFDGTDDYFELTNHNTNNPIYFMSVFSHSNVGNGSVYNSENHALLSKDDQMFTLYKSPIQFNFHDKVKNTYELASFFTGSNSSSGTHNIVNNSSRITTVRNGFNSFTTSAVGMLRNSVGTYVNPLDGNIAEMIVFNRELLDVERVMIRIYLASKYNLPILNDFYDYKTTHQYNVIGVGFFNGNSHTTSRGNGNLLISNPSGVNSQFDFLNIGHDNAGFGTNTSGLPTGYVERWDQTWRSNVLNSPGTIDLEFFLESNSFASISNYVVLIDADGDFSSGATAHTTGLSYNAVNNSITFTGVNFSDGDYFTLAERDPNPTAIATGNWEDASTWSCDCVPTSSLDVTIPSPFEVTINELADANSVTISSGGTLTISGNDTLQIVDGFTISGTFDPGSGTATLSAVGSSSQTFSNSSSSNIQLNNLFVNNSNGLSLTGGWSLATNLQVSSGSLDVSGADSMVLISNASSTAQILESVDNAFTGSFTIQRFISARNSNYGNISSPMAAATVADLDDDLILSGVKGNNGNSVTNGNIFYSLQTFDRAMQTSDSVTSTGTVLTPGIGYQIYLATTLSNFDATTVDFVGTPNDGSISPAAIDQGWNLIGNPYQSFISFDGLDRSNITLDGYYIFETNAGSYSFTTGGTGGTIAPGQGFWVERTTAGTASFDFQENDKTSSNSSTFLRRKKNQVFNLKLENLSNHFSHKLEVAFNVHADVNLDEFDAKHLASPVIEAPAIFAHTENSTKLIRTTLNPFDGTQYVPITVETGINDNYQISASNLEGIYNNYSCIYLKDNQTSEVIDLSVEDTYQFNSEQLEGKNRFGLILSNSFEDCQKLISQDVPSSGGVKESVEILNNGSDWNIHYSFGEESTNITISIFNVGGQKVVSDLNTSVSNEGYLTIPNIKHLSGIYIIRVSSANMVYNKTIKL